MNTIMPVGLYGPLMTVLFVFVQATRDVYFGGVFQELDWFEIILLAFPVTTALFLVITVLYSPHQFARLKLRLPSLIGMNIATTSTWACYFAALRHLEPSMVNTLFGATGLLTAVVLVGTKTGIVRESRIRPLEYLFYLGLTCTVVSVWATVLTGHSGFAVPVGAGFLGLCLTMASGAANTFSTLFERRMNEKGVSAVAIVGTRFIALSLLACIIEFLDDGGSEVLASDHFITIIVAVILLIILPSLIAQIAVAATSPITLKAIMALSPVIVFMLQYFDPRISYSGATLFCIVSYAFFVIGANCSRGWATEVASKGSS